MITTILSLLGGGLGAVIRYIPEILKLFTDKKDRDHEYRMTQLQLEIDRARAEQQIDLVHAQGAVATSAAEMTAYLEAIKGQAQLSGVKWIDAVNQSVRPVCTYWWLLLFTVYKVCVIWGAIEHFSDMDSFLADLWTANDAGTLSMILGFWFVDRAIKRQR